MSDRIPMKFKESITAASRCLLLLAMVLLTACANKDKSLEPDVSPAEMYARAHAALIDHDYGVAVDRYNALEARYPFGVYARRAQIELIFAQYMMSEWESALATSNRFLREYPSHPQVDYVYYMRGRINFERSIGLLERTWLNRTGLNTDNVKRDTEYVRGAFSNFAMLLRRFPDSEYAPDAYQRMVFLKNRLAEKELGIAEFYFRRGTFVAAANRAQDILIRYQGTPAIIPTLDLLIDAYRELGMNDLAQQVERVRELNRDRFGTRQN